MEKVLPMAMIVSVMLILQQYVGGMDVLGAAWNVLSPAWVIVLFSVFFLFPASWELGKEAFHFIVVVSLLKLVAV